MAKNDFSVTGPAVTNPAIADAQAKADKAAKDLAAKEAEAKTKFPDAKIATPKDAQAFVDGYNHKSVNLTYAKLAVEEDKDRTLKALDHVGDGFKKGLTDNQKARVSRALDFAEKDDWNIGTDDWTANLRQVIVSESDESWKAKIDTLSRTGQDSRQAAHRRQAAQCGGERFRHEERRLAGSDQETP